MNNIDADAVLQQLLAPISADQPSGRWMRYEPKFAELNRLREEDNPHLPMGDWERPLIKADWRLIADRCIELLTTETKDFQIAAWLCDAWIHTAQIEGLCVGLTLMHRLAEQYWTSAWPGIDENDTDRRVAPFIWINTHLPQTLRLHGVLLPADPQRLHAVSLLDWQTAPIADDAASNPDSKRSRREIRASVRQVDHAWLANLAQHISGGLAGLARLTECLDQHLGENSPSLAKLEHELQSLNDAVENLLKNIPAPPVMATEGLSGTNSTSSNDNDNDNNSQHLNFSLPTVTPEQDNRQSIHPVASTANDHASQLLAHLSRGDVPSFKDRQEAYAALKVIANYLQAVDPHNPAPYLVHRAIELGNMPFPQMMQEITACAGSMDLFFELLGMHASTREQE